MDKKLFASCMVYFILLFPRNVKKIFEKKKSVVVVY